MLLDEAVTEEIIEKLDQWIARLTHARALLGYDEVTPNYNKTMLKLVGPNKPKRVISAKGKAAIAEGQRKRWAKKKRAQRLTAV